MKKYIALVAALGLASSTASAVGSIEASKQDSSLGWSIGNGAVSVNASSGSWNSLKASVSNLVGGNSVASYEGLKDGSVEFSAAGYQVSGNSVKVIMVPVGWVSGQASASGEASYTPFKVSYDKSAPLASIADSLVLPSVQISKDTVGGSLDSAGNVFVKISTVSGDTASFLVGSVDATSKNTLQSGEYGVKFSGGQGASLVSASGKQIAKIASDSKTSASMSFDSNEGLWKVVSLKKSSAGSQHFSAEFSGDKGSIAAVLGSLTDSKTSISMSGTVLSTSVTQSGQNVSGSTSKSAGELSKSNSNTSGFKLIESGKNSFMMIPNASGTSAKTSGVQSETLRDDRKDAK